MKKLILAAFAAFCAFLITETIVGKVIGYPTYGVEKKVIGIRGLDQAVKIYKPFSKYWTVEGGNKVYQRNNLGLPGLNVKIADNSKYIFVLGNSFLEGYQLPPERIAVSIFQNELKNEYPDYQVINLGISGHDPYDLFWRACYYEKKYSPERIILTIDSTYKHWLKRQKHPLIFDCSEKVAKTIDSPKMQIAFGIVNASSFMNLISDLFKNRNQEQLKEIEVLKTEENPDDGLDNDFLEVINNFRNKYGKRFSLVNITTKSGEDSRLIEYCKKNGVKLATINTLIPKYRMKGKGHFNKFGNKLLGEALFRAFIQNV